MNKQVVCDRLMNTINASVSPYHCIMESKRQLHQAGFSLLNLHEPWTLSPGRKYMVNVFDSALFAFVTGAAAAVPGPLRMAGAHTDWPCLKIKPNPELTRGSYGQLNVEVYGGPLLATWCDRPLSVSGKVSVMSDDPFHPEIVFIDAKKPLMTIPNLPIHLNREANSNASYNPQPDMLPLLLAGMNSQPAPEHFFMDYLSSLINRPAESILDVELCIYNTEPPVLLGLQDEFLSSPRLDNVTSVQACLTGITESPVPDRGLNAVLLYDNEEIGSHTKQGADSMLSERLLEKVFHGRGMTRADMLDCLLDGFFLSMDVAHALHPNHPEKYDAKNQVFCGDGIALKLAAAQSYATDAAAAAVVEGLCRTYDIPCKKFSNHANIRGGGTLGTLVSAALNIPAADIGVPLLAMHSARECIHLDDQLSIEQLACRFFTHQSGK